MKSLYKVSLSQVGCKGEHSEVNIDSLAWSKCNRIACGLTVYSNGFTSYTQFKDSSYEIVIVDPDRPWVTHSVAALHKSPLLILAWSSDGQKLAACDKKNIHLYSMTMNCLNKWKNVLSFPLETSPVALHWYQMDIKYSPLHPESTSWIDWVTPIPQSYIQKCLNERVLLIVTTDGMLSVIWIESKERKQFSLQSLSSCKTCAFHVLADGDVLCLAADGKQVYLYNVVLSADDFKVSVVSVWTPTKQGDITKVAITTSGHYLELHLLLGGSILDKWLIEGSQVTFRASSTPFLEPVASLITFPSPWSRFQQQSNDVGGCMPELLILHHKNGSFTYLSSSYQLLPSSNLQDSEDEPVLPDPKKPKTDCEPPVTVSPNGSCIAFGGDNGLLTVAHTESDTAEVLSLESSSRVLWLAICSSMVKGTSCWDLVVATAILQGQTGLELVKAVSKSVHDSFFLQTSDVQKFYMSRYSNLMSLLESCHSDGLMASLECSDGYRLISSMDCISCSIPALSNGTTLLTEISSALSSDLTMDTSLQEIAAKMRPNFSMTPAILWNIQPAVKWIMEYAVKVVSKIVTNESRIPEKLVLLSLRETLALFEVLHVTTPIPKLQHVENTVSLLFKVISQYLKRPPVLISKETDPALAHLPSVEHSPELSHRKAIYLQGFLHGLIDAALPELYGAHGCGLRDSVLKSQKISDPFSPFVLRMPKTLFPLWVFCPPDGGRDIIRGNPIPADSQRTAALFCTRCQGKTLAGMGDKFSNAVSSWEQLWIVNCFCGGSWLYIEPSFKQ